MTSTTEKATITLSIPNISCGHCVKTISRELNRLESVSSVDGSIEQRRITVEYAGDALDDINATLAEIGYPAAD
jgi:copper chaperone